MTPADVVEKTWRRESSRFLGALLRITRDMNRAEDLAQEALARAIRLAHLLVSVTPTDPESHGLAALLELQSSRLGARVDDAGLPVLLADQDRDRWDRDAIARGMAALGSALGLGGDDVYVLQAAIACEHARASSLEDTD